MNGCGAAKRIITSCLRYDFVVDWQTYVKNLSQKGPRPFEAAAAAPPAQGGSPPVDLPPPEAAGRVFYHAGELVQDSARWLSSEEEWRFNGKDRNQPVPTQQERALLLSRLLDPYVNEQEAMTLLMCQRARLREAVNQGHLQMFRNLEGRRYFRFSQVLALAEKWQKRTGL